MNEHCVFIPVEEYRELVIASCDMERLAAILQAKLNEYSGITYNELQTICNILGIERESFQA